MGRRTPGGTLSDLLAGQRLPAAVRLRARRSRNLAGIVAAQHAGRPTIVAASASVDRARAVAREKPMGIGTDVFNRSRFPWGRALWADTVVLVRAHARLRAPDAQRALLCEPAPRQAELNFEP